MPLHLGTLPAQRFGSAARHWRARSPSISSRLLTARARAVQRRAAPRSAFVGPPQRRQMTTLRPPALLGDRQRMRPDFAGDEGGGAAQTSSITSAGLRAGWVGALLHSQLIIGSKLPAGAHAAILPTADGLASMGPCLVRQSLIFGPTCRVGGMAIRWPPPPMSSELASVRAPPVLGNDCAFTVVLGTRAMRAPAWPHFKERMVRRFRASRSSLTWPHDLAPLDPEATAPE